MGGIGFLAHRVFHSDPVRCWFESAPLGDGCEDFLECFLRVSQNRNRALVLCMYDLLGTYANILYTNVFYYIQKKSG